MKNIDFSKRTVIVMFATVICFTFFIFLTFWRHGAVPDALIEPFFSFFKVEGGALGIIKVSKVFCKKQSKSKECNNTQNTQSEE